MTLKYIAFLAVILLIEYPIYTNHLHAVLSDCSFIAQDVPLITQQLEAGIINKECRTWPQTDQAIQEHIKKQSRPLDEKKWTCKLPMPPSEINSPSGKGGTLWVRQHDECPNHIQYQWDGK